MKSMKSDGSLRDELVSANGYMFYDRDAGDIVSVTSNELLRMHLKTDKEGRPYIQKGGQKRRYLTDTVVSDRGGIKVPDFLAKVEEYEVTITIPLTVNAADTDSAKTLAEVQLMQNVYTLIDGADVKVRKI